MIVSIHQPNFVTWYPFFEKVAQSDVFVIMSHCQFEMKRGYRDYLEVTLDRAAWSVNEAKLMSGGYLNAHGIRPYNRHIEEYKPLIRYIANKFPEA